MANTLQEKTVWDEAEIKSAEARKKYGRIVPELIINGYHVASKVVDSDKGLYQAVVSLPVWGGLNLSDYHKELVGNNGRAHAIYCSESPGGLNYWGNIPDVLRPEERKRDMAEWLKGNGRKIGVKEITDIVVFDPTLTLWENFVTIRHTPMNWKTYVGQIDIGAEFRARHYRR